MSLYAIAANSKRNNFIRISLNLSYRGQILNFSEKSLALFKYLPYELFKIATKKKRCITKNVFMRFNAGPTKNQ